MKWYITAFFNMVLVDLAWTGCVAAVDHEKATLAAVLSAVLVSLTGNLTLTWVEHKRLAMLPISLGAFVGTWLAMWLAGWATRFWM